MTDLESLKLLLRARFPVIAVESHEEAKVLGLVDQLARDEGLPLYTWSVADGLVRRNFRYDTVHRQEADRFGGYADGWTSQAGAASARSADIADTEALTAALKHIDGMEEKGLFLLCDPHPFLDNPLVIRLLKEVANGYDEAPRTLVLLAHELVLPDDLARHAARMQLAIPDADGVKRLVRAELDLYAHHHAGQRVRGDQDAFNLLVQHVGGLPEEDVRRLVRLAIRDDGLISRDDLHRVLRMKRELLNHTALELEPAAGSFDDIGGMQALKRWLTLRRPVFMNEAGAPRLDTPKGVLLLGVQGAGKSLAAKTIAGAWGVPLLRLDFAALYNKFHGESERNLRQALRAADAMAPAILWLDEIEKGLADGGDGDGGVGRRLLGSLLTWMSERDTRVFLVATSNDISRLPPELLRKGRFDELFFVDLPEASARADILRIHLRRRGLDAARFDIEALAELGAGFSGAELEQAIVAMLYDAHARQLAPDSAVLAGEMRRTRPLSVLMAENVEQLRTWAAARAVSAG